jgi:hypothetical protein
LKHRPSLNTLKSRVQQRLVPDRRGLAPSLENRHWQARRVLLKGRSPALTPPFLNRRVLNRRVLVLRERPPKASSIPRKAGHHPRPSGGVDGFGFSPFSGFWLWPAS